MYCQQEEQKKKKKRWAREREKEFDKGAVLMSVLLLL